MRKLIFAFTSSVFSFLIFVNTSIGNFTTNLIALPFNFANAGFRFFGKFIMKAIDSERLTYIERVAEQVEELSELKLLTIINKTKEDAIRNRVWTMNHTMTIQQAGSVLYSSHNWKPARIHGYLRAVVESIPGMTYMAGGDYEGD